MLITLQQVLSCRISEDFLYPVSGRIGDPSPTTGDVNLYLDPATQWSQTPLLFADCEGLDGGDPIALKSKPDGTASPMRRFRDRTRQKIAKRGHERQRREQVVMDLFPKLLYTFSDVVVFVLKEAKSANATPQASSCSIKLVLIM